MKTIQHAYSPEQYSRAVDLWRRLLGCHDVSAYEGSQFSRYVDTVDDTHLYALILADGEETDQEEPVTVSLVSYSDYGGTDFDAANVRALAEDHAWVSTSTDGVHGEGSAWVTLGELPDLTDTDNGLDQLEYLVGAIEELAECPLLSEETHTAYVQELAEEAWDQYLSRDVRSELETALGLDDTRDTLDTFGFSDDDIRAMYYEADETFFRAETATSVVNDGHDEAVEHIADAILSAWRTPWVDPAQLTLVPA